MINNFAEYWDDDKVIELKSEEESYNEYLEEIDAQRREEGIGKTYVQVEVEAHKPLFYEELLDEKKNM